MKVLITGVAGLLGSKLAEWIIKNKPEIEIIGIDDLSGGYIENVPEEVDLWQMDLVSHPIENCFEYHKPDYVFHLAAYAAEGLSPFIRSYNYKNNLVATSRIVNECIKHKVKRLVFTSSMAVYGDSLPPFDETMTPNPIDPYGVAKFACEMDIKIANEQHNLDYCIIRPHNVYGENQNIWDRYRNVLGIWMYQHINGEKMTIFGDGEQTRSFSYVGDCLESLWKCSQQENCSKQIINLGGTKFYTLNEANKILLEIIKDGDVVYLEKRHEVKNAHPTWAKSVRLLGYEDKTSLREGLQKMWNWAKQQPNRGRFTWDKYEINDGLYEFWRK